MARADRRTVSGAALNNGVSYRMSWQRATSGNWPLITTYAARCISPRTYPDNLTALDRLRCRRQALCCADSRSTPAYCARATRQRAGRPAWYRRTYPTISAIAGHKREGW